LNLPRRRAENNCFAILWRVTKLSIAPTIFETVHGGKDQKLKECKMHLVTLNISALQKFRSK
jgi:hypothetical protein